MIELKIKTPQGEKVYQADDITLGAMEECVKMEHVSNEDLLKQFPEIIKLIFPDIDESHVKYIGFKQIMRLVTVDVPKLMAPVENVIKN